MGIVDNLFKVQRKKQIVFLIDGPNTIRKGMGIDLREARRELQKYGDVRVSKIYLDQYASDKLIEAMFNQGFKPEITTGDVDVTMAIDAMEYLMEKDTDILALMTRDTDFTPLLRKANKYAKKAVIVAVDAAFSAALKNTADIVIVMKPGGGAEHLKNAEV